MASSDIVDNQTKAKKINVRAAVPQFFLGYI